METIFQPRKELFRQCCGHCIFARKVKTTGDLGMREYKFICDHTGNYNHYGHKCDVTATPDGEQLELEFDICDGNHGSVTNGHN